MILDRFRHVPLGSRWPEAEFENCKVSLDLGPVEGEWFCTRERGHHLGPHVAHYEDENGRTIIGVAWTRYEDF